MKAAVHTKYGSPQVVAIQTVEKPVPGNNELLVKVHATTVNRTDCGFRSANYVISRFFSGLFRPNQQTLGCEFAGEVVEVGPSVQQFQVGDRVFGYDDTRFGGHAEYKLIGEDQGVAPIPEGMQYREAAPLTEGSHYALCYLRAAKVKKGDKVLVYGASGAIGSAAVQLAKELGAYVVAVAGTPTMEAVALLGADEVIDYLKQDITKITHKFQLVLDAVGKRSFGACKHLLRNKGIYASTELGKGSQNVFLALITPFGMGRRVIFPIPTVSKGDIQLLKALAERGSFRPVIDREYTLENIVEAYSYVETGQKVGNVVVLI